MIHFPKLNQLQVKYIPLSRQKPNFRQQCQMLTHCSISSQHIVSCMLAIHSLQFMLKFYHLRALKQPLKQRDYVKKIVSCRYRFVICRVMDIFHAAKKMQSQSEAVISLFYALPLDFQIDRISSLFYDICSFVPIRSSQ